MSEANKVVKRNELWFAFWRRYLHLVGRDVAICSPNKGKRYRAQFESDNTAHDIEILYIRKNEDKVYVGYNNHIYYDIDDVTSLTLFSITKGDGETNSCYKNIKDKGIPDEHISSVKSLIQLYKTSNIDEKLYDICRYIHAFKCMMKKTNYLKYIESARLFMLCSRTTFPRDISKIIYKKIIFFIFCFQ